VRDWDKLEADVAAAGAVVYVLTTDAPEVVANAARKKKLTTPIHTVTPALWASWGLANPRKDKLPHPSTVVIGPDGTVRQRITHVDYRKRADASAVLAALGAGSELRAAEPERDAEPSTPAPIDWDGALVLSVVPADRGVTLVLTVAPGFHVYGAKEKTARPLAVRIDGETGKTRIPPGDRKDLGPGVGVAWVLEGEIRLTVPVKGDAPSGELDVQLCTEGACSAPVTRTWSYTP
jgi:hypothetical protein